MPPPVEEKSGTPQPWVTPLGPRFETEAFELLPYETAQLFRAAELQNEVDEEDESSNSDFDPEKSCS